MIISVILPPQVLADLLQIVVEAIENVPVDAEVEFEPQQPVVEFIRKWFKAHPECEVGKYALGAIQEM